MSNERIDEILQSIPPEMWDDAADDNDEGQARRAIVAWVVEQTEANDDE